jgi:hypothetical protein
MSDNNDTRNCRVTRFTVYGNPATSLDFSASEELGAMTWGDLKEQVAGEGGQRVTYDLFDVPQHDGTTIRYRAVDA